MVMAGQFEVYKDKDGMYRWKLLSKRGMVIADAGKGYRTRMAAIIDLWNTLNAVTK
jgi:uncharacterized protein YegP (UPF0339 family)